MPQVTQLQNTSPNYAHLDNELMLANLENNVARQEKKRSIQAAVMGKLRALRDAGKMKGEAEVSGLGDVTLDDSAQAQFRRNASQKTGFLNNQDLSQDGGTNSTADPVDTTKSDMARIAQLRQGNAEEQSSLRAANTLATKIAGDSLENLPRPAAQGTMGIATAQERTERNKKPTDANTASTDGSANGDEGGTNNQNQPSPDKTPADNPPSSTSTGQRNAEKEKESYAYGITVNGGKTTFENDPMIKTSVTQKAFVKDEIKNDVNSLMNAAAMQDALTFAGSANTGVIQSNPYAKLAEQRMADVANYNIAKSKEGTTEGIVGGKFKITDDRGSVAVNERKGYESYSNNQTYNTITGSRSTSGAQEGADKLTLDGKNGKITIPTDKKGFVSQQTTLANLGLAGELTSQIVPNDGTDKNARQANEKLFSYLAKGNPGGYAKYTPIKSGDGSTVSAYTIYSKGKPIGKYYYTGDASDSWGFEANRGVQGNEVLAVLKQSGSFDSKIYRNTN